jgi:hypothetical protein
VTSFLEEVVSLCPPQQQIHIILDSLSAHKTQLVRDFLQRHPPVQFHFTPTYSSWLNQVEIWFAKIERQVIARGIFTSVPDLARKLRRYINAYSINARPIQWKYSDPSRRANEFTATVHERRLSKARCEITYSSPKKDAQQDRLSALPVSDISDSLLVSTARRDLPMQCEIRDAIGKYIGPVQLGIVAVALLQPGQSLPPDSFGRQRSQMDRPQLQAPVLVNSRDTRAKAAIHAAARYGVKIRRPVFRCRRRPAPRCYLQRTRKYRSEGNSSKHERLCAQCCRGLTSLPT